MQTASRIVADEPSSAPTAAQVVSATPVGDPAPGTTPYRKRSWWGKPRKTMSADEITDKAQALAENTALTCAQDGCDGRRSGFGRYCATHGAESRARMKDIFAASTSATAEHRAEYAKVLAGATKSAQAADGKLKAAARASEPSCELIVPKRAGFGAWFAAQEGTIPANLTYVRVFAEYLRSAGFDAKAALV